MRRRACFWVALLVCCLQLCACQRQALPAPSISPEPTADATPQGNTPAPVWPEPDGITLSLLSGYIWVDAYDPNITLTFDAAGSMTETDHNVGTVTTRGIRIENGEIMVLNTLGLVSDQWPVWFEEGLLYMDAGDPVGELTYRPAHQ